MVEQSIKALGIRFQARIQLDLFEELFLRRLTDERVKIPKAMEADFFEPATESENRIRRAILEYRTQQGQKWEADLRRQRERLSEAERSLAQRATKKAAAEQRIATNKIAWFEAKLSELQRDDVEPKDTRVFPHWYAPVVCSVGGERVIRPMRYHLRPHGKPASIDQRFDGLYNARRDSLTGFWRGQFGTHHAVVVVTSFFENVARHDFERRSLLPNEASQNVVVQFRPTASDANETVPHMTVACVWDRWQAVGEPDLLSFAAITDDPPAEIAATGHDRCVVALREENVSSWLLPAGRRDEELFRLLAAREPYFYQHRLAG